MARKIGQFLLLMVLLSVLQVKGLKAEEIPKFCQVICPKPDGNGNYYRTAPEVTVKHLDENLVTRYQLSLPGGRKIIGKLQGSQKSEVLSADMFVEGSHKLDTWLEDMKGQVISGTEQSREFQIDRNPPILTIQFAGGTGGSSQSQSDTFLIEVEAEDGVSGVAGIYYTAPGGEEQYIKGNRGFVSVSEEFQNPFRAYAVDFAGNKSQVYEIAKEELFVKEKQNQTQNQTQSQIQNQTEENEQNSTEEVGGEGSHDNSQPRLEIEGFENYAIVGKNLEYVCRVYEADNMQSVNGEIIWENKKGETQITKMKDWEEAKGQYVYYGRLSVDGIYHITVEVIDAEGEKHKESRQVIIDKTNPVIQSIAELDGARLTSFQWGYHIEGLVSDFTTYTYEVRLDGVLCDVDKVYTAQGKHILELRVTDAAGNESRATAVFQIVDEKTQLKMEEEQEKNPSVLRWIWPCILLILLGLLGFVWIIKEKIPIKREEAR